MSKWSHVPSDFSGSTGVVIATGPSLSATQLVQIRSARNFGECVVFGMNNVYQDIDLDVHIACDPKWWQQYGKDPDIAHHCSVSWTWDEATHDAHPFTKLVQGRWGDGLSTDPAYIHYGHSSSYQCLNLAVLYGCAKIVLVGFDMEYAAGQPRHYFNKLSGVAGEYPEHLRKWSKFDGLLKCYDTIGKQKGLPRIVNCTPAGALHCFERGNLQDELRETPPPTS